MGMQIFEQSGTFRPADWGLKAGDIVQVIAVGGGGGGNGTIAWRSASSAPYWEFSQQNKGGDAGKSPGSNGGGGGAGCFKWGGAAGAGGVNRSKSKPRASMKSVICQGSLTA